jgi:hypothetical protein
MKSHAAQDDMAVDEIYPAASPFWSEDHPLDANSADTTPANISALSDQRISSIHRSHTGSSTRVAGDRTDTLPSPSVVTSRAP